MQISVSCKESLVNVSFDYARSSSASSMSASSKPPSPSPSSFSYSPFILNYKGRRRPPPPAQVKSENSSTNCHLQSFDKSPELSVSDKGSSSSKGQVYGETMKLAKDGNQSTFSVDRDRDGGGIPVDRNESSKEGESLGNRNFLLSDGEILVNRDRSSYTGGSLVNRSKSLNLRGSSGQNSQAEQSGERTSCGRHLGVLENGGVCCEGCSEGQDLRQFARAGSNGGFFQTVGIGDGGSEGSVFGDEFFDAADNLSSGSSSWSELLRGRLSSSHNGDNCDVDELQVDSDSYVSAQNASVTSEQEEVFPDSFMSRFSSMPSHKRNFGVTSDLLDLISQRLEVTRLVASAIARGAAKAEVEVEFATILETKNREISRLRDKLQYYETLNHEMSQRNQESIEIARRQRHERQRRLHILISCLGITVFLGLSAAAVYKYFPWSDLRAWNIGAHSIEAGEGAGEDSVAQCT